MTDFEKAGGGGGQGGGGGDQKRFLELPRAEARQLKIEEIGIPKNDSKFSLQIIPEFFWN